MGMNGVLGGAVAVKQEGLQQVNGQTLDNLNRLESILSEITGRMQGNNLDSVACPPTGGGTVMSQAHEMRAKSGRLVNAAQELLELL